MNNYRGISILPPIAKIFERLLAEQMRLYFEINNLFFHGQHGFRTNHSCESALHELISKCFDNKDKKLINCLLFVDFKKAFDMIDRRLLLQKLAEYGFMNNAIMILESYFTNRKQLVKIGENKSNLIDIDLGVPQGSVLGPLLFLIYKKTICPYFYQITSFVYLLMILLCYLVVAQLMNVQSHVKMELQP